MKDRKINPRKGNYIKIKIKDINPRKGMKDRNPRKGKIKTKDRSPRKGK